MIRSVQLDLVSVLNRILYRTQDFFGHHYLSLVLRERHAVQVIQYHRIAGLSLLQGCLAQTLSSWSDAINEYLYRHCPSLVLSPRLIVSPVRHKSVFVSWWVDAQMGFYGEVLS